MADGERLYFTIGPVQSFVAQSRRTRDLWASSYLLSHLADVAMRAIEQAGGKIILPYRERHEATESRQSAITVQHGRWPNRFVAIVENPKGIADAAKLAMLNSWKTIADAVWRRFVEPVVSSGTGTKAIWDRQVSNFWEVSWVIARAPSPGDPDPLSLRKNWRITPMAAEPGDHCTMMGSWQELSGHIRSQNRNSREKQDQFWKQIRSRLGKLDLGDDERFCAVALVKRMFPLIAKETIGIDLNAASWLSTPYIAAIPWLKRVCERWPQQAHDYLALVKKHRTNWQREVPDGIASLQSLLQTDGGEFLRLDADFLHDTALANERDTPLDVSEADEMRVREELVKGLGELHQEASKPSSFYAMLLMDGDSMGRLLSEARASLGDEGEQQVTRALGQFADRVSTTVSGYDGVTVYCGGDDVFAMMPVGQALRCAIALSKLYGACFAQVCQKTFAEQATISAGIVYCPFRTPLREVSATAHHLLDDVAKDQSGRNSLAVAVLKSSGLACQWSAPWDHVQANDATILDRLVNRLGGSGDRPGELSSGFLFQIRERYALLTNDPLTTPGRFGQLPEGMDASRILLAEYLRGRSRQGRADGDVQSEQAKETIKLLMKVCQRAFRKDGKLHIDAETLGMDGALLVRFLAGEAQEVGAVSTRTILLTPIDAWFFRDGRPYNQGESGQTDVRSLFPPFAPTVVGTLRAALAVGQGWNGRESWANELHPILGNGFDDLGQLQFHGPFLVRDGKCLFPVPLHLLGRAADHATLAKSFWSPSAFLAPNLVGPVLESDLGPVRFPVPIRSKGQRGQLKEPTGLWATAEGYSRVLRGELPDAESLAPSIALWKTEQRVGLARNHDRRAADEGALYSPEYVRLFRGVELATVVEGIPEDWLLPNLIAFGGESRLSHCVIRPDELPLPQSPVDMIRESNRFTVSLLSPLCSPTDSSGRLSLPLPGECFPGVAGATIVSACVGKPVQIGGWNSLKREPLPLIPYLPAGSTWFCEADPAALDSILALHGRHIGERTPYGFGQIALGAWPHETGDTA